MSLRTAAAVLVLLAASAGNPASAQPVAPRRPQANAFQNLFFPGNNVMPNAGLMPFGGNNAFGGGFGAPGFGGPGLAAPLPNVFAYAYGPGAAGAGPNYGGGAHPVVFNSTGRYYGGYYGHWYPNGISSGVGVMSNTGFGMGGYGFGGGGLRSGMPGMGGVGMGGIGVGVPVLGVGGGFGGNRR